MVLLYRGRGWGIGEILAPDAAIPHGRVESGGGKSGLAFPQERRDRERSDSAAAFR
jgi:hypothetical protein